MIHYIDIFQFSAYRIKLFTKKYIKYVMLKIQVHISRESEIYISTTR